MIIRGDIHRASTYSPSQVSFLVCANTLVIAPEQQYIPVDEGFNLAYGFTGQAGVIGVATGAANDSGFDMDVS